MNLKLNSPASGNIVSLEQTQQQIEAQKDQTRAKLIEEIIN